MSLLAPLALWGLLAGLVPLALHLRRRRVGRTIQVGSLRHLDTLPTAERRGHRLRDPLRLLLRLAIIGAVVLSLADPALPRSADPTRPFIVADSATPQAVIDSLRGKGAVHLERLDEPWVRIRALDDSLPALTPLVVAASPLSDLYSGPRPVVGRAITWHSVAAERHPRVDPSPTPAPALTATERRALEIAVTATREEIGPLSDSAGWMERLPSWWRDSLATAAFPLAVARALAPARTTPPQAIGAHQLLPRQEEVGARREGAHDLHWWVWGVALLLLLIERLWVRRLPEEG